MKFKSQILVAGMMMAFAVGLRAQDNREAFRAAMDACVSETGVSKPERGIHPSEEDRAKIDACLTSKGITKPEGRGPRGGGGQNSERRAAFEACIAETGLTKSGPGTQPSEADRATMKACLESKGLSQGSSVSRQ